VNNRFENICIVLVEPQSPGNIGMVCRAMKNMGLENLRIVKGCDRLHPDAVMFAVSAKDILENAIVYPSLAEALSDTTISVATTRRKGKYRQELLTPPQVANTLLEHRSGMAALVFGREDHGLSTEELSICSLQGTISSSSSYGSLNLAQAVLVFCYELFGAEATSAIENNRAPAKSSELEALFTHMQDSLSRIGFLNPQNPAHIMRSLRRILFRSGMDSREVSLLRGMFNQIDWAASEFDGRKKNR
jgi:tRNA/rRNA methyltransferase